MDALNRHLKSENGLECQQKLEASGGIPGGNANGQQDTASHAIPVWDMQSQALHVMDPVDGNGAHLSMGISGGRHAMKPDPGLDSWGSGISVAL